MEERVKRKPSQRQVSRPRVGIVNSIADPRRFLREGRIEFRVSGLGTEISKEKANTKVAENFPSLRTILVFVLLLMMSIPIFVFAITLITVCLLGWIAFMSLFCFELSSVFFAPS